MLWVLDLVDDVESDLSAFHRVDDMEGMGSRRWARLVPRLSSYSGAIRAQAQAQQASDEPPPDSAARGGGAPLPVPHGARVIPSSRAALQVSDIGHLFSFGS